MFYSRFGPVFFFNFRMKCHNVLLFSFVLCVYIVPYNAENAPIEEPNLASSANLSSTPKPNDEERLGFIQAFLKTLSVIFVSEIGDKTFFIAAIMAMKHPRVMVFLGAISALAFMTIISVLAGWMMSVVPKIYTYYGSVILFLIFGLKMIYDGMKMSPNEGQEEYEEVQASLRKKEEERAKMLKQLAKPKKDAVSPATDADLSIMQVLPVATEVTEISATAYENNGNNAVVARIKGGEEEGKDREHAQFEKETLTKDLESGYVNKNSKVTIFKVLSHIVVQAFTLTFVAEWGDRSQLATFLLASKDNKFGITLGGILGHSICTGIAVTGGRIVAQKISVKTVTILGGFVFIVCALYTIWAENSDVKIT